MSPRIPSSRRKPRPNAFDPRSRRWVAAAGMTAWLLLPAGIVRAQSFCEPVAAETLVNPTVLGNGTPGSVTTAQIQAALDAGGAIRLDQGPSPTTIVVTQTLVASRESVLDGGGLVTLSGGNARRILSVINPNPAPDAPLFRVTLQNLNLTQATIGDGRGGAIYKQHDFEFPHKVSLKLVNCRFEDNQAPLDGSSQDDGGGAFYGELMNRIDIGNCVFRNNTGSNGGAVYSLGTLRVNIVDSLFEDNAAIGSGGNPGNGGNAGALGVDGAARLVDVCRTRFVANESNAYGAGFFSVMYDAQSRTRFEDVLFQDNRQLDAGQHTGGAYIQDGPWALERVSFIGNDARGFGGLFVAGNAPGTIRNATFSNNVARTGLGAAMALTSSAAISIVNTTIANNVSTQAFAAGIAIGAPNQLRLTNVLFANNTGGNVFVNWAMSNPAQFDGGGNMQWPQVRPMNGGNETPVTAGSVFANAQLPPNAANNGGLVPTLALAAGSPALNGGVNTAEVPPTDARGVGRVGGVDRGSYELDPNDLLFGNGFESP
jgi:predicted outer membrane repeat protein